MENNKTCLYDRHVALGAQIAPFAGYDMPIEYSGLDSEHQAVRTRVGLFDVSHMGEIVVAGPQALAFVNHIFTNDAAALHDGQVAYGMMCRPEGGTVDDLLVYRVDEHRFFLVVNASNVAKDYEWVKLNAAGYDVEVTDRSAEYGQLAIQGPEAEAILSEFTDVDLSAMPFYTFTVVPGSETEAVPCIISRTGYTGEDGFEIYASPAKIVELWDRLIARGVAPCGLGCRDTLRFEAGLPLYGDELAEDITPIEAGLGMFVKLDKPEGFIGSEALKAQKAQGVSRKLVGLELEGGATARHGFEVLDMDGKVIGYITTGYNSLTLGRNIAMALIDAAYAPLGTKLQVKIRRRTVGATVIKKRFYVPKYKK